MIRECGLGKRTGRAGAEVQPQAQCLIRGTGKKRGVRSRWTLRDDRSRRGVSPYQRHRWSNASELVEKRLSLSLEVCGSTFYMLTGILQEQRNNPAGAFPKGYQTFRTNRFRTQSRWVRSRKDRAFSLNASWPDSFFTFFHLPDSYPVLIKPRLSPLGLQLLFARPRQQMVGFTFALNASWRSQEHFPVLGQTETSAIPEPP